MANTKGILSGELLLEIERWRYDQLLAKEERLRLLEETIKRQSEYDTLRDIKKVFDFDLYGEEEV